ncbi:MAG TPA: hypothetical protein VH187_08045 [Scandinavium sp.]|jgi:hypothetical protein|uniref:hypothetical protein n=1 Tax=Scandinavium sp. TaxID=2830653 RepID=UPI002E32BB3B|nr:hypothetical protein [Scandinavium sp.]HEX4501096.1 hypothetical protein [Scandinavium sp.]
MPPLKNRGPATHVQVEVEVFGDKQISRHLLRFGERAVRATPLWNSLYRDLQNIEKVQFLTEGGHGSGGWAELAPSTVADKEKRNMSPWILRASEILFNSLTGRNALGQIKEIGPDFMRFGSDIPYGVYHQRGTVHMPMRKVIDITGPERVAIVKKIQMFLVRGVVVPL